MKKLIALLLAMVMVFSLIACGNNAEPENDAAESTNAVENNDTAENDDVTENNADDDEIVIAGVVFQDDQFMNLLTQGYVDAANDLGVKILTDNTNNDQAKETELINTYLGQGVDGLAIAPLNPDASVAALREADAQGMKVALTNIDLSNAEFIVAGYTSSNYENTYSVGTLAAGMIKEKHGDETIKLAIVQFKSLLADQSGARIDGYLAALDDAGVKYEIVADQDAWKEDTAMETASSILTAHPDIDVMITANSGGTIGTTLAVQQAGLSEQIMVFGHDGTDQTTTMILDPNCPLQAVVAQDPYFQGYNAVTALVNAIRGEDYSATKGKCEYVPGIVLSVLDKEAINTWRTEVMGWEAVDY